jgi:hypothetical protein
MPDGGTGRRGTLARQAQGISRKYIVRKIDKLARIGNEDRSLYTVKKC